MTIKDIKNFLEQFDDAEVIVGIEFERDMDICHECDNYYYDEYYNDCANVNKCSCNKHKNNYILRIAFKSDISENDDICYDKYHTLNIEDSE